MMKFFMGPRSLAVWGLICSLLLLSACATTTRTADNVENRAMARWNALLSNDFDAAYEFLSPGYRSSVSNLHYQRTLLLKKLKWNNASFVESDCAETSCKVKISLDYTMYGGVPGVQSFEGTQAVTESWVLIDRVWYLVPKQ